MQATYLQQRCHNQWPSPNDKGAATSSLRRTQRRVQGWPSGSNPTPAPKLGPHNLGRAGGAGTGTGTGSGHAGSGGRSLNGVPTSRRATQSWNVVVVLIIEQKLCVGGPGRHKKSMQRHTLTSTTVQTWRWTTSRRQHIHVPRCTARNLCAAPDTRGSTRHGIITHWQKLTQSHKQLGRQGRVYACLDSLSVVA